MPLAVRRGGRRRDGAPNWRQVTLRGVAGLAMALVALAVPDPAAAAVSFRSAASASSSAGAAPISHVGAGSVANRDDCGSISPGIPAGSAGDLLVATVVTRGFATSLTLPGWNVYFSDGFWSTFQVAVYWRIATGADSADVTSYNFFGCDSTVARVARFSGVDIASPFDPGFDTTGTWVSQDSDHIDTGTVTTSDANAMAVVASFIADNRTVTPGAGWTESFDSALNISQDSAIALSYQAQSSAGAKSVADWDLSSGASTDPNYGIIFALRPSAAAAGLTVATPTGTAADDVMIATLAMRPSSISVTPPAGWTQLRRTDQGAGNSNSLVTYYRVADGSESASYTWSFGGGAHTGAVGAIASYTGVDTATPVEAEAGSATASSVSHEAPSVTSATADSMLVTAHAYASAGTWTAPGGMTEAADVASLTPDDAGGISMEMNYEARPTAGATGTRTATASTSADTGATQALVLKAALPDTWSCYSDNFDRANGAPGSGWIVSNRGGSFGDPVIFNNRLRLTNASGNVATLASLQRLFPGAGNRIEMEFQHFAYGGSGADGIAVVLSDASVNPWPGSYGGSLGYAQRNSPQDGFAGGWLGIGIDEYGNFSNSNEGRVGGPGLRRDSVAIRGSGSGTSGYVYHRGTAANLSPEVDNNGSASPPHRYRVIIDHTNGVNAWVSVERDTGGGYVTLIPAYDAKAEPGQAAVPTNWLLSFAASTGGSTNVHEIDDLSVCATYMSEIEAADHVQISHDGDGLMCDAEHVTFSIHDVDDNLVPGDGVMSISTSTGRGSWSVVSGAAGSFTNLGNGNASYDFTGETNITLALHYPYAETVNINTSLGGLQEAPGEDPDLVVGSTGFRIVNAAGSPVSIGSQIAGKPSNVAPGAQDLFLQAVRWDTDAAACVAAFPNNTDVAVELGSRCLTPGACTVGQRLNVTNNGNSVDIPNTNDLEGGSDYVPMTLRFGANAMAALVLNYPNAGEIRLRARYNLPNANGTPSGVYMSGSSSDFVVRPFGFRVTATSPLGAASSVADSNGNGSLADEANVFAVAGQAFDATVSAVRWQSADDADADGVPDAGADLSDNAVTPDFGDEGGGLDETVSLTPTLVEPVAGSPGSLTSGGVAPVSLGGFSNGSLTVPLVWDEVGVLTLQATLADGDYLGSGQTISGSLANIGRFRPDRFLVSANTPDLNDATGWACAFTYWGQTFDFNVAPELTVRAVNTAGATTTNYTGAYWKLDSGLANRDYADASSGVAVSRITDSGAIVPVVNSGSGVYTVAGDELAYVKPLVPAIPFASTIDLGVPQADLTDSDGVCLDADDDGSCEDYLLSAIGGTEQRYGRLAVTNGYGAETRDLTLPVAVQTWQVLAAGPPQVAGFATHLDDACTTLAATPAGPPTWGQVSLSDYTGNLAAGETAPSWDGFPGGTATLAAGAATLRLSAPGTGDDGSVRVDLLGDGWLQFDWDGNGAAQDAWGRASFGIYRGSDRVIYIREVY